MLVLTKVNSYLAASFYNSNDKVIIQNRFQCAYTYQLYPNSVV